MKTWRERLDAGQFVKAAEALEHFLDNGEASFSASEETCLRDLLFHPDAELRQQAVRAVGVSGDVESVAALAKLYDLGLDQFDHDYIFHAFEAIGKQAVPHLADLIDHGTAGERSAALQGLACIGGDAVPVLLAAAGRQADDIAVTALSNAHDPRAVPLLLEIVERGGDLADSAASALEQCCDPTCSEAVEPILRLLRAYPDLATNLIDALGSIRDPRAIPALQQALKRGGDAAEFAVTGLGQIADPRAPAALLAALGWPRLKGWTRYEAFRGVIEHTHTSPGDRRAAARRAFQDFERCQDLEELLEDLGANADCRAEAISAGQSEDPFLQLGAAVALASRELFQKAAGHSSKAVRVRCAQLAFRVPVLTTEDIINLARDPEVSVRWHLADNLPAEGPHTGALLDVLTLDRNAGVRIAAICRHLRFMPVEEALPYIERLVEDKSPAVRQQAAMAAAWVNGLDLGQRINLLARFLYDPKGRPVDPRVGEEIHDGREVLVTVSVELQRTGAAGRQVLQEWKRRGGKKGQPPSGDPFRWG